MAEDTAMTLEKPQQRAAAEAPAALPANKPEAFWQPLAALRDEVDRLFDSFWHGLGSWPARRGGADLQPMWRLESSFGVAVPSIDVVEAEKEYRVVAELPGMGPGDVDLSVSGDVLTIKGEKREEKEEKTESYRLSERRFGSFQRSFQIPPGVDHDAIGAAFEKGVLTITLPKTAEAARQRRRIEVKAPAP